jgi:hypothetical protein
MTTNITITPNSGTALAGRWIAYHTADQSFGATKQRIVFVGRERMLTVNEYDEEHCWMLTEHVWYEVDPPTKPPQPKVVRRLSPAVACFCHDKYVEQPDLHLSVVVFASEHAARSSLGVDFRSWPAMQEIDGKLVPIVIVVEE